MRTVSLILLSLLVGCGGSGSGGSAKAVGNYSPAAARNVAERPKLGISTFKVEGEALDSSANLGDTAADQFGELLKKSNRFDVVPRAEFYAMLDSQRLSDIVRPGQFMRTANVDGVDYILVGSITNLRITKKAQDPDMMKKVTDFVKRSADNGRVMVSATCGVGFQIIDPSTRDIVLTNNSELNTTAGAAELGLDMMNAENVSPGTELPVSREDRVQIMQLAIDDAIRKSLPKIDRFLASQSKAVVQSTPTATATSAPTTNQAAPVQKQIAGACAVCGEKNEPNVKFCKKCGAKL